MADDELPRVALERILARASELQVTDAREPGEGISEARLLEIATEVGLDAGHVRQAIAEERARLPMHDADDAPGVNAFGPAMIGVQRTVPGTPAAVLQQLENALPRTDSLVPIRRSGARLILEPRRGFLVDVARALGTGTGSGRFDLARLDSLVVSATAVDDTRSVVRFDAVLTGARRSERTTVVAISTLLTVLALAVSVPLFVFSLVLPAFAVTTAALVGALALGSGWLVWRAARRRYRTLFGRAQMRLEALLDDAEHGRLGATPGLLEKLLR